MYEYLIPCKHQAVSSNDYVKDIAGITLRTFMSGPKVIGQQEDRLTGNIFVMTRFVSTW